MATTRGLRRATLTLVLVVLIALGLSAIAGCKTTEHKSVVREEPIAYQTVEQEDASLPEGETKVEVAGQPGVLEVSFDQTWVDGEMTEEVQVGQSVKTKPVDEVITVGTNPGSLVYLQRDDNTVRFFRANADGSEAKEFATFPDYGGSYVPSMGRNSFDSYEIAWSAPYVIMEHYDHMQGGSLQLVNVKTGKKKAVVPAGENHIRPYSFSPDCTKIYYVVDKSMRPGAAPDDSFWVYDIASGKSKKLMGGGAHSVLIFSPDGSKVGLVDLALIGRGKGITIMDSGGGNQKTTDELPDSPAFFNENGSVLYLDDGRSMVDVADDNSLSNQRSASLGDDIPNSIHAGLLFTRLAVSYRISDSGFTRVSDLSGSGDVWEIGPGWRPDGRAAAFISSGEGNPEVYVIDSNGGTTRCTNDFEKQFDARLCSW